MNRIVLLVQMYLMNSTTNQVFPSIPAFDKIGRRSKYARRQDPEQTELRPDLSHVRAYVSLKLQNEALIEMGIFFFQQETIIRYQKEAEL